MTYHVLEPYGWDNAWSQTLDEVAPGAEPARVVRHDGAGLLVASADGGQLDASRTVMLSQRLEPAPTAGDWVAIRDGQLVAVLPRRSLLRRRAVLQDREQVLAANVDLVLLVNGVDRPVKDGRIQRGAALAADSGAVPVVVLTKALTLKDDQAATRLAEDIRQTHPGLQVIVTSVKENYGIEDLREVMTDRTVTLLGESGAGKSAIVNALFGEEVAAEGRVRKGDAKGRHTTRTRQLYLLPTGGVIIDTPGIRAMGLRIEPEKVTESFTDIDDLSENCRFSDCEHSGEPGCAIAAAVKSGEVRAERVAAWDGLRSEAQQGAQRKLEAEWRKPDRDHWNQPAADDPDRFRDDQP